MELDQLKEKLAQLDSSNELFAFIKLLLDEIPFEWLDKNETWLAIAHQLNHYGETDLADIFQIANHCAFQLSLQNK